MDIRRRGLDDSDARVQSACGRDLVGADIDADDAACRSDRRGEAGEQRSATTADLEDSLSRPHRDRIQDGQATPMEVRGVGEPPLDGCDVSVVVHVQMSRPAKPSPGAGSLTQLRRAMAAPPNASFAAARRRLMTTTRVATALAAQLHRAC